MTFEAQLFLEYFQSCQFLVKMTKQMVHTKAANFIAIEVPWNESRRLLKSYNSHAPDEEQGYCQIRQEASSTFPYSIGDNPQAVNQSMKTALRQIHLKMNNNISLQLINLKMFYLDRY